MAVELIELQIAPRYLWAAGIVWPPIVIAIVVARFTARHVQRTKIKIDDWLTFPALVRNCVLNPSTNY